MITYAETTERITVTVRPAYLDSHSDFVNQRFAFGYAIEIENHGSEEVQLLRRHWTIRETTGRVQEVEGEGVIGQKPIIGPGEVHQYSSFCILQSFEGSMEGTYLMQRPNGARFRISIPRFDLRAAAN